MLCVFLGTLAERSIIRIVTETLSLLHLILLMRFIRTQYREVKLNLLALAGI